MKGTDTITILPKRTEWRDKNGRLHREDGPAVIWEDGDQEWFINGVLHRLDGPAINYFNSKIFEWHVNGNDINHLIHPWAKIMGIDLDNLTEYDKTLINIKWSEFNQSE